MEFWEKEYEKLLKQENENRKNAKPLSDQQLKKNIDQNWIESVDENGEKHFTPRYSIILTKKPSSPRKKIEISDSFLFVVAIAAFLFVICIIFLTLI
ncbi:MAG: hypothetical protein ACI4F0_07290 [Agathobacter sp.]